MYLFALEISKNLKLNGHSIHWQGEAWMGGGGGGEGGGEYEIEIG